uniref:Uncharacterized protein n=1 Tax=Sander lucioperca TaxID=283035 RepID=A0A8C9ZAW7_SANLU
SPTSGDHGQTLLTYMRGAPAALVTLDNLEPIAGPRGGDVSFEYLPYQLLMVLSVPTMVTTGNRGKSGASSRGNSSSNSVS